MHSTTKSRYVTMNSFMCTQIFGFLRFVLGHRVFSECSRLGRSRGDGPKEFQNAERHLQLVACSSGFVFGYPRYPAELIGNDMCGMTNVEYVENLDKVRACCNS